MRKYHNFKLVKSPSKITMTVDGKERPKEWVYGCSNCDSEIKIKQFMTDEQFNRDVHRLYPHFACIAYEERINYPMKGLH